MNSATDDRQTIATIGEGTEIAGAVIKRCNEDGEWTATVRFDAENAVKVFDFLVSIGLLEKITPSEQ